MSRARSRLSKNAPPLRGNRARTRLVELLALDNAGDFGRDREQQAPLTGFECR
jgi:hypothetical protein